jgi:biotin operon repressor
MERVGQLLKERLDHIVFENKMMQAGFAAVPYELLRDKHLSVGARFIYSVLLMYGWQEGSSFAGQQKMAEDVGISRRNIQRFLYELRDVGYIRIERQDRRFNNTYVIVDKVMTKLKTKPKTHHVDLDAPRAAHPMRH